MSRNIADLSNRFGACALVASLGALATCFWTPRPRLLWNASASSPIGLYAICSAGTPRRGDTVVAWAPASARALAAGRHYLPLAVPLVKPVAAAAGDRVCAAGSRIIVNGRLMALRRPRDASGKRLPLWSGCHLLRRGQIFLLSAHVADAFDGRYFGITHSSELVGRAMLLWAGRATTAP